MLEFKGSEAYDLSLFEPQVIVPKKAAEKTSAEPRRRAPSEMPKKAQPVRKTAEKALEKTDAYQKTVARDSQTVVLPDTVKKCIAVFAVGCIMVFALLIMRAGNDKLQDQISDVQSQLTIAKGESVRLNSEMSSKMSRQKMETYAEKKLGMVKAESYQITYIDLSKGDEIVVSGDKTLSDSASFSGKIKELFAYIF